MEMFKKWYSMTGDDKKFFVGVMLLGVLVLGGISWYGLVYRPSHMAKRQVTVNEGMIIQKTTYVSHGDTIGIVTLLIPSFNQSNAAEGTFRNITLANGTVIAVWCSTNYRVLNSSCETTVTLTFQLPFYSLSPTEIATFSEARNGQILRVTRTYLCDGYSPNSITDVWISGCALQDIVIQIIGV